MVSQNEASAKPGSTWEQARSIEDYSVTGIVLEWLIIFVLFKLEMYGSQDPASNESP